MNTREWLMLFGLAALWSTSFYLFKVLLGGLPVLTIVFGRVALAAAVLWAVVYLSGNRMPKSLAAWGEFLVSGLLSNVLPFCLIVFAETRISSGLAAILNATTPLFGVLFAHFWTHDERFTAAKIAGLGIGFAGVAVLVAPSSIGALNIGALSSIAASVIYGIAGVYGKRFKNSPPLVTAAGTVTASSIILLPAAALIDKPWHLAAWSLASTWFALGALAVFATALAYILFFRILATAGATNLLLVTFIVPVGAVAVGAVLLHETLSLRVIAGAAIVFVGLGAIDGRLFKLFARRPADEQAGDREQRSRVA